MKLNSTLGQALTICLYVLTFFIIQFVCLVAGGLIDGYVNGGGQNVADGNIALSGPLLTYSTMASSLLTIILFLVLRWSPFTRMTGVAKPMLTLGWVALFTLGTLLPFQWIEEQLQLTLPEGYEQLFNSIMSEPMGFLVLGILAPIAEEMVFRGAVLRHLLSLFRGRSPWLAIAISALAFGAVHGNSAQMFHATLLGLIIGWLYVRSGSILPGLVLHWVNNTVACVMYHLLPQMADGKLIDLFQGNERTMWMALGFSLCILLPSWYQLLTRLGKGQRG